jgi:hypothetical protein
MCSLYKAIDASVPETVPFIPSNAIKTLPLIPFLWQKS